MVHRSDLDAPGSTTQIRHCCHDLVQAAKPPGRGACRGARDQGGAAGRAQASRAPRRGPRLRGHGISHRVLRAAKNRFGSPGDRALRDDRPGAAGGWGRTVDATGGDARSGSPRPSRDALPADRGSGTDRDGFGVGEAAGLASIGSTRDVDRRAREAWRAAIGRPGRVRGHHGGARVVEPLRSISPWRTSDRGCPSRAAISPGAAAVLGEVGSRRGRPVRHVEQRREWCGGGRPRWCSAVRPRVAVWVRHEPVLTFGRAFLVERGFRRSDGSLDSFPQFRREKGQIAGVASAMNTWRRRLPSPAMFGSFALGAPPIVAFGGDSICPPFIPNGGWPIGMVVRFRHWWRCT